MSTTTTTSIDTAHRTAEARDAALYWDTVLGPQASPEALVEDHDLGPDRDEIERWLGSQEREALDQGAELTDDQIEVGRDQALGELYRTATATDTLTDTLCECCGAAATTTDDGGIPSCEACTEYHTVRGEVVCHHCDEMPDIHWGPIVTSGPGGMRRYGVGDDGRRYVETEHGGSWHLTVDDDE